MSLEHLVVPENKDSVTEDGACERDTAKLKEVLLAKAEATGAENK